ncbi:OLC1v1007895C1 [Oldenlandia corymbosa var. corymbosa]|uniref:OLC1v1007895C1 n=1 Tax=Oldenlandia corymbosa var. corymbosa TaxID=529605 RepID=A0AAV1DKA4_OLDCO|nr:OLC1v1007895C1 [Oldenlandia corymbosa var. corymbosa]
MTPEMMHQRFMELEHHIATQVARFEHALQMISDQNMNSGNTCASGSMVRGNSTATGTTPAEVPPVNMINNPLYNAVFQTSATDTPVQNTRTGANNNRLQIVANMAGHGLHSWYYPIVLSQPALILPPRNFTYDGLSAGTSAATNLDDPYIPQGSGVVVNPQIVPLHQTLEENIEEQQWMEYEANQILNRNKAQAVGRPYGNQNGGNVTWHNPQQQRFFGQKGGRHRVDIGNEFRQELDATVNANQQHDFEVGVEQTLNVEETFLRMVEHMFLGKDERRPENHISLFKLQCGLVSNNAIIKLRLVPYSLKGTAFDWDAARLSIVDLSEIRQKFGENAEACLIRFRQMYAKIPDKYEEPTIVKTSVAGIQDYKKMIDDGNVIVEDPVEMNTNPFPTQHQVRIVDLGFGGHAPDICLITGCEDCNKVFSQVKCQLQELDMGAERNALRSDSILSALNQHQHPNAQHSEEQHVTTPSPRHLPVQSRLGKPMHAERVNDQHTSQNHRQSVWQRIG